MCIRDSVREAYQKNGHKYRTLDDQMIHQFRMYIDKHNIEYVRNYFKGPTDYAKLQAYAKNFEMKLYYGEPSRPVSYTHLDVYKRQALLRRSVW